MKNLSKYLIGQNSKLQIVLKKISLNGEKILFVVNKKKELIGVITDGDVRRSILKKNNLEKSIINVFNTRPFFFKEANYNNEELLKNFIKRKINAIPIVDNNKKIIKIIFFSDLLKKKVTKKKVTKKKINTICIIMAGGMGTRLEPFTKILPKPLIPINNKAIIEHIIEEFKKFQIKKIYLTVNYKSLLIKSYFRELKLESSVNFIQEREKRGTIGGIKKIQHKIKKPFFVSNCDVLVKTDYSDLYEFHLKNDSDITIVASTKKFKIPYGVCDIDPKTGTLKKMLEKPVNNYLINTGLYVLSPRLFKIIPNDKKFDITDLINLVDKKKINVFPIHEKDWIDVGQWPEYHKATKQI